MKKIVLIVFTAMTVNACHQGNNTTYINVNPALKAAFNYKVGTYWIYQDSLSGEVDSFCVNDNSDQYIYTSNSSTSPTIAAENISISIPQYNVNANSRTERQIWGFNYGNNEMDLRYSDNSFNTDFIPFIYYPNNSLLVGDSSLTDSGSIINVFNELLINGQAYLNVIEVNHYSDTLENRHNDTFFVAPSAGIIKMILNHPSDSVDKHRIWELLRYHIVK